MKGGAGGMRRSGTASEQREKKLVHSVASGEERHGWRRGWCSPLYLLNFSLCECITYSKRNGKKLRNKGGVWGCTPLPLWAGKVVITTLVGMIIFLGRLGGRGSCGGLAHTLPLLWATWHAPPPKKNHSFSSLPKEVHHINLKHRLSSTTASCVTLGLLALCDSVSSFVKWEPIVAVGRIIG